MLIFILPKSEDFTLRKKY